MGNYHLEVQVISRGKGRSVTRLATYISGEKLRDSYFEKTYYHRRQDVLNCRIFLPPHAPPDFHHLQELCDAIEAAEVRWDARTAREFKGSLPNELPLYELQQIVSAYINENFVACDLCAIAAIHAGRNPTDHTRDNPHVHIIVPTRTVTKTGFSKRKDREHDKRAYIHLWREQWATVQNRAYERNGLDIRVSNESLQVQGIDLLPTIHLSRIDWQKEQRGERTLAGDRKRFVEVMNKTRYHKLQKEVSYDIDRL